MKVLSRLLCLGIWILLPGELWPEQAAAATTLAVQAGGRTITSTTPGARIAVVVRHLPAARHAYCLGLASMIDRYGLPANLGRLSVDRQGTGRLTATIPAHLFPAEPPGPFLLFAGTCTPIAPDRPFVARATIRITPAAR